MQGHNESTDIGLTVGHLMDNVIFNWLALFNVVHSDDIITVLISYTHLRLVHYAASLNLHCIIPAHTHLSVLCNCYITLCYITAYCYVANRRWFNCSGMALVLIFTVVPSARNQSV